MKTLLILTTLTLALQAQQTPATAKAEPTATPVAPAQKAKPNADGTVQITISLGRIYELKTPERGQTQSAIDKLFNTEGLPVKMSYQLGKVVSTVNEEKKRFEEERQKLIKKYGKVDGGNFWIPPENMKGWAPEINALSEIPVNLTIVPVPLAALGEKAQLSPNDMARLQPFLIP